MSRSGNQGPAPCSGWTWIQRQRFASSSTEPPPAHQPAPSASHGVTAHCLQLTGTILYRHGVITRLRAPEAARNAVELHLAASSQGKRMDIKNAAGLDTAGRGPSTQRVSPEPGQEEILWDRSRRASLNGLAQIPLDPQKIISWPVVATRLRL
ncbi:hypothetical protein CCMA1212_007380 [Trichoderma ghanense]|uniref:Uncharacterized protein n=1 Tax=Trichoderma ghanense TaxID=65468 RepID=A0ABY2H005_9HYPO